MNRESAALGVPVYSIFLGTIGAVDRYLSDMGRLTLIKQAEDFDLEKIIFVHRDKTQSTQNKPNATSQRIVDKIVEVTGMTQ